MGGFHINDIRITGYYPGVVGEITTLHATYYYDNWRFDVSFETQVGRELSDFLGMCVQDRDGFWVATVDGIFAGAVAIDGSGPSAEGARLRWFIVAPAYQGKGVGRKLLQKAVKFCKSANHERIYLWTFKGLHAARSLYEGEGFKLREEHDVRQWGSRITEQMFDVTLV